MNGADRLAAEFGSVWACERSAFDAVARCVAGGPAAFMGGRASKARIEEGRISVIPIRGVIVGRKNSWGFTSTEQIGEWLGASMADRSISKIILDVDSPGGSVSGLEALAQRIRGASGIKRVVASVNDLAASAAYWLASQASEVVVSPGGRVGSIGVFSVHIDISEMAKTAGIKVTYISSTDEKVEMAPEKPLSKAARDYEQAVVTDYYRRFLRDVGRGRGTTVDHVEALYGQGRLMSDRMARTAGAVDAIGSLCDVAAAGDQPVRQARILRQLEWQEAMG